MRDINSLRLNSQFKRAYDKGKSSASYCLVVYARKVQGAGGLGITASKKIGKAVQRNRAKRRIRALYRKYKDRILNGYDIVIVARTKTVTVPFFRLEEAFLKLLGDTGVLKEV